jgi:hypothetical protein
MSEPQLLTAEDVEPALLDAFLRRVYSPLKSDFLIKHGSWWHHSNANRLVILVDGQPAAYSAVIPVNAWIAGQFHHAMWLVDVMTAQEFRGRGLQAQLDRRLKEMTDLLLGFPNELAAIIHRKHGWGVREDMQILLLPLSPGHVKMVRNARGRRASVLRAGALVLSPLAAVWRARLSAQRPANAWRMESFTPDLLADVFMRTRREGINTTWRDAAYFSWRYGLAPHPEEYAFYLVGERETPSHFLIARHVAQPDGVRYTRILDVFGDFDDQAALAALLTLAVQDAISHRSGQMTLLAARPELRKVANWLGFLFPATFGFCWWSASADLMSAFAGENYWTLGDSDNDAPD